MGFSLGKAISGALSGGVSGAILGSVVPGIGTAAGAVYGAGAGALGGTLDAYQDKTALKYQNAQNIALWNMQNEYNTPANQMKRFMDAGLNPNLIYSQSNEAGSIQGGTLQNHSSDIGGQIRNLSAQRMATLQGYSSLASQASSRAETDARTQQILETIKQMPELLKLQKRRQELAEKMANQGIFGKYIGADNAGILTDLINLMLGGKQ